MCATVTPTINGDDTITVVMQPELSSQSPTALGVPVVSQNRVSTIANVRDGDTNYHRRRHHYSRDAARTVFAIANGFRRPGCFTEPRFDYRQCARRRHQLSPATTPLQS